MENVLIITWNMQGAGRDPLTQYCLLLDKMQEYAKLYMPKYKMCFVQECGSPDALAQFMPKGDRAKVFLDEVDSIVDDLYILKHYALNDGRSGNLKVYDFYAVWRLGDAAKRCGTGIILPAGMAGEKPVILNSYIEAQTAEEEEDVADELVLGEGEAALSSGVIKQTKHPRPILGVNINDVWFCTMHAIANRNAAKKQLPQCLKILNDELDGDFIFGGDFNCVRTELAEFFKRMRDDAYSDICKSVSIYGCGLKTQGAGPNRNSELDYFLSSLNFTAAPPVSKISVCEKVGRGEVYAYSDHDMVCACFTF